MANIKTPDETSYLISDKISDKMSNKMSYPISYNTSESRGIRNASKGWTLVVKISSELRRICNASINIRAQRQQRDLIDRAVKVLGKNRSDFMLEAACKEAENILLDRRYFALEQKGFNKFLAALDKAPTDKEAENILLDRRYFALEQKDFNKFLAALDKAPTDNERLRRTLTSQPPWER